MMGGLVIEDGDADGELDVTIGAGASSVTTISGVLDLGDRNINNVGVISLDSIVTDGGIGADGGDLAVTAGNNITIESKGTGSDDGVTIKLGSNDFSTIFNVTDSGDNSRLKIVDAGFAEIGGPVVIDGQSMPKTTVTTDTNAGNRSGAGYMTAANIVGGFALRDPAGGDRTDTTDTAANIVGQNGMLLPKVGSSFRWIVRNTADAAETITIAAGSGVTLSPASITIAQNQTREFLVRADDVGDGSQAVTIFSIGVYTT